MVSKTFPDFRKGQTTPQTSAREMQTMSNAAERADRTLFGSGINSLRTGDTGQTISLDPVKFPRTLLTTRLAADVVEPGPTDIDVIVREVAYANEDPVPVDGKRGEYTYRWASDHRVIARPVLPLLPSDFQSLVFPDVDNEGNEILPTAMTPVCIMQLRAEGPPYLWLPPGTGTRQFRVFGIFDEHLTCKTFDSETGAEGTELIRVLRPLGLRNYAAPYVKGGISYSKVGGNAQERLAVRESDSAEETQVVVTRYRTNEDDEVNLIYATNQVKGGLDVDSEGVSSIDGKIDWLEVDSRRAWHEKAIPSNRRRRR